MFLVTDVSDKLSKTIELLQNDNKLPKDKTLRELYDEHFHPDVIDLSNQKIWDALADGSVQSIFQFDSPVGRQTAKAIKPQNPDEMTAANALLRLTAPEGQERPFDRYVRFKNNLSLWYQEMNEFGLTKEEQSYLEPYYLKDYGVPANQEALMLLVMDEHISNFTLGESNTVRKVLAKKQIEKIPEVKNKFLTACTSPALGKYAWRTMMEPQMS